MSHDKHRREKNKRILSMGTQPVENIICPHCKNNKNRKLVRAPAQWQDVTVWHMECVECHKEFDLHFVLQIHTLPTVAQLEQLKKEAEANEEKARRENNVPESPKGPALPGGVESNSENCGECKGVGPHTHSNEAATDASESVQPNP